jgi:hypothetical protein
MAGKAGGLVAAVLSNTVSRYHLPPPPAGERLSNASSFKRLSRWPAIRTSGAWPAGAAVCQRAVD